MSSATRSALSLHAPDSPIAYDAAGAITAGQFHADVLHLAEHLPDAPYVLNTCEDRYLFMLGLGASLLRGKTSLMPSSLTAATVQQLQERYEGIVCLHDADQRSPQITTPGHKLPSLPLSDVHVRAASPEASPPLIPDEHVAAIVFTSGTTGEPSAHAKHWGLLCRNGAAEAERLQSSGLAIVATVPAQHMYGFESSVLLALQGGASVWRQRPFYPADIASALQTVPARRMLVTTPFHLATLLDAGIALPACEKLLCATAPLSTELAQRAEAALAAPLFEIYGCTESGQVASRRTLHGPAWRLLPGLRMSVDAQGAWVHDGHVQGRVLLSDQIEPLDAEHFKLGDRHADMVNIAGKRASLAALNAQLQAIPGVLDACYLRPETLKPHAGEAQRVQRLAALIVAPDLDTAEVLRQLRQRIDAPFLPRPLLKVDALPRNATGKLQASELAALFHTSLAATDTGTDER